MRKGYRTILVFFLLLIFFFLFPALILYSTGTKFDFEKKRFVKTGGIYIKTNPLATIYLNQKRLKKTEAILGRGLIENLLPKRYKLRIEKENFFPLEKEIEVRPNEVYRLVTPLFPKLNFSQFEGAPQNLDFLKKEAPKSKDIVAQTKKGNDIYYLDKTGTVFKNSEKLNFEKIKIEEDKEYNLIILANWVFIKKGEDFYYLKEGKIEKVDKNIKGLDSFKEEILAFTDNEIYLFNPQEKEFLFLYRFSENIKNALFLSPHYLLISIKDKVFAFEKTPNGNLYLIFEGKEPQIFYDQKEKKIYIISEGKIFFSRFLE